MRRLENEEISRREGKEGERWVGDGKRKTQKLDGYIESEEREMTERSCSLIYIGYSFLFAHLIHFNFFNAIPAVKLHN